MTLATHPTGAAASAAPATVDWSRGWREETVRSPDGETQVIRIPLTDEELLHPREGYSMPERTDHDRLCSEIAEMLRAYYADRPDMAVYRNLSFVWDKEEIRPLTPDVAVVPQVRERERNRSQFVVAAEETRPILALEIVSDPSRQQDRVTKLKLYARVGVTEYVYIDGRPRRGQTVWEIAGFRLEEQQYTPLVPDEDGGIYCATVDLRIGIDDGQVWLEDAKTGLNLLTNLAAQRARLAAEERATAAEARREYEAAARLAAEARIAELEDLVRRLQGTPNQPKGETE